MKTNDQLESSYVYDDLDVHISIDGTKLPEWGAYYKKRDKFYGVSIVGRWWAQKVRPRLLPPIHRLSELAMEIAECDYKIAFGTLKIAALKKAMAELESQCSKPA